MTLWTPLLGIGGTIAGFFIGSIPGAIAGGALATGGSWGANKLGEIAAHANIDWEKGENGIQNLNQD